MTGMTWSVHVTQEDAGDQMHPLLPETAPAGSWDIALPQPHTTAFHAPWHLHGEKWPNLSLPEVEQNAQCWVPAPQHHHPRASACGSGGVYCTLLYIISPVALG